MWVAALALCLAAADGTSDPVDANAPVGCRPEPLVVSGVRYWDCGTEGVLVEHKGELRLFAKAPPGFRVGQIRSDDDSVIVKFTPLFSRTSSAAEDGSGSLAAPGEAPSFGPFEPIDADSDGSDVGVGPAGGTVLEVEVVETDRISVVLSDGVEGDIYYGDVFEFLDASGEVVAAGEVQSLQQATAEVRLWMNHPVEVGMKAVLVEWRPSRRRVIYPPQADGYTSASFRTALFVQSGQSSGVTGAMVHVQGRHHFGRLPLALVLDVGPAFFISDPRSNFFPTDQSGDGLLAGAVDLVAEVDLRAFGFGLGGGGGSFNRNLLGDGAPRSAAEMVFRLRLGARDGLRLKVSPVMAFPEGAGGPTLGRIEASLQMPLGNGFLLNAEGAGGRVGYSYGVFDLRVLFAGKGLPVSWLGSLQIGAAEVRFDGDDFVPTRALGALVGVGLEARF